MQQETPPPPPATPSPADPDKGAPAQAASWQVPDPRNLLMIAAMVGVVSVAALLLFSFGIEFMLGKWQAAEYNHGWMVPPVALYLLALRAGPLAELPRGGSWLGVGVVLVALAVNVLGEMSAVVTISQYALLLAIWGLAIAAGGGRSLRLLWVPLLYLVFMVPLPNFLEVRLTTGLQLMSSALGVAVIRLAGHSVFLAGNVIDLGIYKLQVDEACSGMRYLFPLMSFGFLCAVLFRGRWWQRAIVMLSTIPITLLMNSFRIGVIGILVNLYGIEQAEGFLHDFEGWVVFMACVGVLMIEIWIFARMQKQPFLQIFGLDIPEVPQLQALASRLRPNRQLVAATAVIAVAALLSLTVSRPAPLAPERQSLSTFPLSFGEWQGRDQAMESIYTDALQVSDYLLAEFSMPEQPAPIGVWIAWYDSQVQGASVHSPQACLPGGGWQIEKFETVEIPGAMADGGPLPVNRVEIGLGEQRQLVYYWFAQRGRVLTNEFLVKWYIFWDGLTRNRTDGALVRMTTFVTSPADLPAAEARLQAFVRDAQPKLAYYLPGAEVPTRPLAARPKVAAAGDASTAAR